MTLIFRVEFAFEIEERREWNDFSRSEVEEAERISCIDTYGRIDTTTLRTIYRSSAVRVEEGGGWETEGRIVVPQRWKRFRGLRGWWKMQSHRHEEKRMFDRAESVGDASSSMRHCLPARATLSAIIEFSNFPPTPRAPALHWNSNF